MRQYFPKTFKHRSGNVEVHLDLSIYAIAADLKEVTGVDTSNSAAKSHLTSLKAEVDKIDTDKLKTVLSDLSKIINVVENVVKKLCMISSLLRLTPLILVDFFYKLNIILINQV